MLHKKKRIIQLPVPWIIWFVMHMAEETPPKTLRCIATLARRPPYSVTKVDVVAAYGADAFEIEVLPSTVREETLKELVGGNTGYA
jgi:hypothetical protein